MTLKFVAIGMAVSKIILGPVRIVHTVPLERPLCVGARAASTGYLQDEYTEKFTWLTVVDFFASW